MGVGKRIEGQGLRGVGKRRHVETSEGLDVETSRNPEVPEWELLVHTPVVFRKSAQALDRTRLVSHSLLKE